MNFKNFFSKTIKFILLFFHIPTFCLFEQRYIFANSSSLSNAYTSEEENISVIYFNPAGLFNISKFSFYSSNTKLYNINNLNNNTLCFAFNKEFLGNFGFLYTNLSFNNIYNENLFSLVYSKNFFQKISVGISLKNLIVDIKNYSLKNILSLDLGILSKLKENLFLSFVIKNFNTPQVGFEEQVLKEYVLGIKFNFNNRLYTYTDLIKNFSYPLFIRFGQQINLNFENQIFILRFGLEDNFNFTTKYSCGLGFIYKKKFFEYLFDYCYLKHTILGEQHIFSLGFNYKILKVYTEKQKSLKININKANLDELISIPGIGIYTATKILEYREKFGMFNDFDELLEIPRISKRRLEKIKPYIKLKDEEEVELDDSNKILDNLQLQDNKTLYNLNTITYNELISLGFSFDEAKNIIRFKQRNKRFYFVEDLYKIPNIEYKKIDKIRHLLYVE